MTSLPYAKIEKGTFLVSSPDHDSGIFFRAVILICEHNLNGSFGLVINKPLNVDLPDEILQGDSLLEGSLEDHHMSIRGGGPVQTNQMMLLHNSPKIPNQTMKILDGVFLGGDLAFLQETFQGGFHHGKEGALMEEPEESEQDPAETRMFLCFGYAGWSSGQLEREYLNESWFLHPASAHHVFDTPPEILWTTLLREMGGKYATLSMIPEDLSVN